MKALWMAGISLALFMQHGFSAEPAGDQLEISVSNLTSDKDHFDLHLKIKARADVQLILSGARFTVFYKINDLEFTLWDMNPLLTSQGIPPTQADSHDKRYPLKANEELTYVYRIFKKSFLLWPVEERFSPHFVADMKNAPGSIPSATLVLQGVDEIWDEGHVTTDERF